MQNIYNCVLNAVHFLRNDIILYYIILEFIRNSEKLVEMGLFANSKMSRKRFYVEMN